MERYDAPARYQPTNAPDERGVLSDYLDHYRNTLLRICGGLTPEQLKQRAVASSTLTLLGLVRHMAAVEQFWYQDKLAGRDVVWYYDSEESNDNDFDDLDGVSVQQVFANYDEACRISREIAAGLELDAVLANRPEWDDSDTNLRSMTVHMIEEYARHCGHADLLRELIDGATNL